MDELKAFHFTYEGEEKAETFKFYQRFIRGFLRWHRGSAVWVKGSLKKREAYIIVKEYLAKNVVKMLTDMLDYGGNFVFKEVNPIYVVYEAKELEREIVGYLRSENIELGDSDEIHCPKESYKKTSVQDWCWGQKRGARCDAWDGERCIYPKMNAEAQRKRDARLGKEQQYAS